MGTKRQLASVAEIDYWNRMTNHALAGIDGIPGLTLARLRSQIISALQEVDRDARHRSAELALESHDRILNARPV